MKLEISDGWVDPPIPAHGVWVDHFWRPIKVLPGKQAHAHLPLSILQV